MARQIFVNLPVKDLNRSVDFFTKLGFEFNQQFTNESATCMVIEENIFVMLLVEPFFQSFTKKPIGDTKKSTEVLICISAESREAVDELVRKALEAGGGDAVEKQDHGWMYGWGFEDLDGHHWEVAYTDLSAFPQEENAAAAKA